MTLSPQLPFPALVGLDTAQQALLLLAVEPQLRGLVLQAPVGSGKSSLARSFRALLSADDASAPPFIELPSSVDDDGLLGGIDMQATLQAGRRVARPGVLQRAHGGVLYADGLNLLADGSVNVLLDVLERGVVTVEREGLSSRAPARFRLVGSYDPAEGMPRRHLLDRVGLLVVLPAAGETGQRTEIVRRNRESLAAWHEELDLLRGMVQAAREQLPHVQISDEQITALASAAVAFGVEGHRADTFAMHAARAAAALDLRDTVENEDLALAMRLVIVPRATRMPQPEQEQTAENKEQTAENREQNAENKEQNAEDQKPRTENQEPRTAGSSDQEQPPPDDQEAQSSAPQAMPEQQVFEALAAELPDDLTELPFRAVRRGRSGSRGSTSGRRGRHIRSVPGDPRRARLDIGATLRVAAPWQPLRRAEQPLHRTVLLRADDLRVKQFRAKAGALFCFAVDASGSMALHRMRQAKGAVHALLQRAYVQRDRVALLAFRGEQAELLLPPSQSVELAQRALDVLPTGGGTPLATALLAAIEVAAQARSRGIHQTVLVLLTDGRANVGLRADRAGIKDELQHLAQHVVAAGIQSIVVDTQRSYLSRGDARELAGWLAGTYVYLPNARGEQIADAAMAMREA